MPETTEKTAAPVMTVRYRGRTEQVGIYFGKFLRMFFYQNDWKVLPMAALIAGLVGMVMKWSLFQTMEGTLMGSFALVMVCIWNGCFNSIQVICRERDVIKREHRSGMHISSYIVAHMMYQAILCLLQTGITLNVTYMVGLRYDLCHAVFSRWFLLEFGLSMFLITFAADMMALWISTLARSTTTAMTIMPFVLIFQLVFSGGMLTLPEWTAPLKNLTISAPGLNVLTAQGDYNKRPLVAIWNRVQSMGDVPIEGTVSMGQVLDLLDNDAPMIQEFREKELSGMLTMDQVLAFLDDDSDPVALELRSIPVGGTFTVEQVMDMLLVSGEDSTMELQSETGETVVTSKQISDLLKSFPVFQALGSQELEVEMTLGELIDMAERDGVFDRYRDHKLEFHFTVGEIMDMIESSGDMESLRKQSFPIKTTIAELQSRIGVEAVRSLLQDKAAEGSINPAYANTRENVAFYWARLLLFVLIFAALATVTLEFIDKDKR